MDIKRAIDLETLLIFQQLFELIFYMYNSLCFCLNQPIQAKQSISKMADDVQAWAQCGLLPLCLICYKIIDERI
jgi:hypothetical protein